MAKNIPRRQIECLKDWLLDHKVSKQHLAIPTLLENTKLNQFYIDRAKREKNLLIRK